MIQLHRAVLLARLLGPLLLCLFLAACGGKQAGYSGPPAEDVLRLPQDLTAYAPAAGGPVPLVAVETQRGAAERQREALFRPWTRTRPASWIKDSLVKNFNMRPDKAFIGPGKPFPQPLWDALVANSNKKAFGLGFGPAVTLRHTNLRAMPTALPFFRDPSLPGEGYPFDYFQHTSLPPGTPLAVCNSSADGLWLLVESPATAGWLPSDHVAGVDEDFMALWQSRPLAALVRDNVDIGGQTRAHIGALLPLEGGAVLYPKRGVSGRAEAVAAQLPPDAVMPVPVPLSADNLALVGNRMMRQPYGWGGLDEKRDCSALTRDLFAPFGLYLPRNSASQAKIGLPVDLTGLSASEKESLITARAAPFRSLLWLRGHIALYLGLYEGRPVMFHNMWGIRTKDADGGCTGRAVVGKAVVTSTRPGAERPDLCNGTLIERMERAAVLLE